MLHVGGHHHHIISTGAEHYVLHDHGHNGQHDDIQRYGQRPLSASRVACEVAMEAMLFQDSVVFLVQTLATIVVRTLVEATLEDTTVIFSLRNCVIGFGCCGSAYRTLGKHTLEYAIALINPPPINSTLQTSPSTSSGSGNRSNFVPMKLPTSLTHSIIVFTSPNPTPILLAPLKCHLVSNGRF